MPDSYEAPPANLDRALEVGPHDWQGPAFYQLLTALVVPRPIGWISTISQSGVRNLPLFVLQSDGERPGLRRLRLDRRQGQPQKPS